jgi:hypothetical protein
VKTDGSYVGTAALGCLSSEARLFQVGTLSKNHKAGLVGPAFPLWNWFVGLCWIGKPECLNLDCRRVYCSVGCAISHSKLRIQVKSFNSKAEPSNLRYITIARFSNSCWRTGIAQPAISTRPAASSAAVGETP